MHRESVHSKFVAVYRFSVSECNSITYIYEDVMKHFSWHKHHRTVCLRCLTAQSAWHSEKFYSRRKRRAERRVDPCGNKNECVMLQRFTLELKNSFIIVYPLIIFLCVFCELWVCVWNIPWSVKTPCIKCSRRHNSLKASVGVRYLCVCTVFTMYHESHSNLRKILTISSNN